MRSRRTRERAAVRVARELVDRIRRGRLRPGTQLAAEHQMVEDLGVSRATVREALRFLELQGALRIKTGPGGGPVVDTPGADHLASVLSLHLQFADASFRSVVEARCSIYPVLAAEAAENASPEDVAALDESIGRLRGGEHDPDLFREEARRLMNLIATASGNRVLAILVEALHLMSGEKSAAWDEGQRRSALRSYERVIRAIEAGDGEKGALGHGSLSCGSAAGRRTAGARAAQAAGGLDRSGPMSR